MSDNQEEFNVSAGKYDQDEHGELEENCKYCESFKTLGEALEALKTCNDYPWFEITYCHKGIWYRIDCSAKF